MKFIKQKLIDVYIIQPQPFEDSRGALRRHYCEKEFKDHGLMREIKQTNISENIKGWQNQIGYIPQSIYLLDDTVRNNVAFGLTEDSIDDEKIWKALKLAQLDEFVKSKEKSLDTIVGENGVRLSGGQRQRIGIARALYFEPHVLIMDEATGALDNETERVLMESIETLGKQKTIIIIAHRLSTIKNCDVIFFLGQGHLIASGTYGSLIEKNAEFRQLAGA